MTGFKVQVWALKRVYEAPFPERADRLPLGQASKRRDSEEAGLSVTGYPPRPGRPQICQCAAAAPPRPHSRQAGVTRRQFNSGRSGSLYSIR